MELNGREIHILKSVREINLDGEEVFLETFIDLSEWKNVRKERINNEKRFGRNFQHCRQPHV